VDYQPAVTENIFLEPGLNNTVDIRLEEKTTDLSVVTVVSRSKIFDDKRTGASINISNRQIITLPTISRSADDYLRLTPPASANYNGLSFGINFKEMELTQCRVFFVVNFSPLNTCPKCASQFVQTISTRLPSASGLCFTAPAISSSKLGQPQCESNLSCDLYKGVLQRRQMYVPVSLLLLYSPVKGLSVPL